VATFSKRCNFGYITIFNMHYFYIKIIVNNNLLILIILIGDSAYEANEWLMVPMNNNPNDNRERKYNRAHKSTRRIIECSYGILKNRFPCLKYLRVDPCFAGRIIMACATLHNVANKADFIPNSDAEDDNTDAVIPPTVTGHRRETLLEFFNY